MKIAHWGIKECKLVWRTAKEVNFVLNKDKRPLFRSLIHRSHLGESPSHNTQCSFLQKSKQRNVGGVDSLRVSWGGDVEGGNTSP